MVSTVAPHMTLKIWQRLIGAAAGLDVDERKSFKRTCKFMHCWLHSCQMQLLLQQCSKLCCCSVELTGYQVREAKWEDIMNT